MLAYAGPTVSVYSRHRRIFMCVIIISSMYICFDAVPLVIWPISGINFVVGWVFRAIDWESLAVYKDITRT